MDFRWWVPRSMDPWAVTQSMMIHGPSSIICHVTPPPSHPAASAPLHSSREVPNLRVQSSQQLQHGSRDKTSQLSSAPLSIISIISHLQQTQSTSLPVSLPQAPSLYCSVSRSRVARDNRRPYSKRSAQHSPNRQHARRGRARGTSPIRFLAPPALT